MSIDESNSGDKRLRDAVLSVGPQAGLDKKVVQDPVERLMRFLSDEWAREVAVYIDYYSRLAVEARRLERVAMSHNPNLGLLPDGQVGEFYDEETLRDKAQFYIPDLYSYTAGSRGAPPVGTLMAWQDVTADWGWAQDEDIEFDQAASARALLLEWQKTERLRQRLLERQDELKDWLRSYRPMDLPVDPVDWEANVITDMYAFFVCQSKKGRAETKYLSDLLAKFNDQHVMLDGTSFAKRIFDVIHRGN